MLDFLWVAKFSLTHLNLDALPIVSYKTVFPNVRASACNGVKIYLFPQSIVVKEFRKSKSDLLLTTMLTLWTVTLEISYCTFRFGVIIHDGLCT